MKSINEIIKDLNLIRLSGTRNFILLELNGSLCKLAYLKLTKPFYQLKDKEILNDIKIFSTKAFNWENSYEMISDELNSFIKTSGCNNPILLVGINEYKFTPVSLPAHIESEDGGEDIWFSENSSRFLPDGSYLDSFVFSYEKITEDENYKTFSVIVVRKDYLNNILRCLDSFKIGGIFPFIITITALKSFTTNVLLIDFSINKVTYSFYDTRGKLFVSELFTNIYNNQHNLENRKLNTEELANSLIEIKNFLHSSFPGQLSEKLSFFICCQKKDLPEIEKCVWEIFSESVKINEALQESDPFSISGLAALNKFITHFDSNLTLLEEDKKTEVRTQFEKQAGLRVVLASGIVLLALLFISYISDFVLSYRAAANENIILQAEANKKQIELLEKQNSSIKKSLSLFVDLKSNRSGYSDLLFNLSEVINTNCRFTNLEINESRQEAMKITLNGISRSQNDVAEFINALEKSKSYKNVSVANISAESKSGSKNDLEFRLTAEYNVKKFGVVE